MKKIFFLLFFAGIIFPMHNALAYISGKAPVEETKLYCPQEITCSEKKNISSCKFINETPEYWSKLQYWSNKQSAGVYHFTSSTSGYHGSDGFGGEAQAKCVYSLPDDHSQLLLTAKQEANLEAYIDRATLWHAFGEEGQYSCNPNGANDAKLCPLKRLAGFGISFKAGSWPNESLKVSIAGNEYTRSSNYLIIRYEELMTCWNSKQCKIDFNLNDKYGGNIHVGSAIVDMDNNANILNVIPDESAKKLSIAKLEPYNVVEVKHLGLPEEIYKLKITDRTRLKCYFTINDYYITPEYLNNDGESVNLLSNDVAKMCSYTKECVLQKCPIQIRLPGGGVLGTMEVDLTNKMKVLSVSSIRPQHIAVTKVDDHSVEIRYPNK